MMSTLIDRAKDILEKRAPGRLFVTERGVLSFPNISRYRRAFYGEVTLSQLIHWLEDTFGTADAASKEALWEIYRPWYRELLGRHGPSLDLTQYAAPLVKFAMFLRDGAAAAHRANKTLWFEGPASCRDLFFSLYDEWQAEVEEAPFPVRHDQVGEEEVLVLAPGWDFQAFDIDFEIERHDPVRWHRSLSPTQLRLLDLTEGHPPGELRDDGEAWRVALLVMRTAAEVTGSKDPVGWPSEVRVWLSEVCLTRLGRGQADPDAPLEQDVLGLSCETSSSRGRPGIWKAEEVETEKEFFFCKASQTAFTGMLELMDLWRTRFSGDVTYAEYRTTFVSTLRLRKGLCVELSVSPLYETPGPSSATFWVKRVVASLSGVHVEVFRPDGPEPLCQRITFSDFLRSLREVVPQDTRGHLAVQIPA